ncbi:MAG: F0F1 ATP synthase subunit delta [candidate division Zixibacteria bacterium]|nr:F0F1 ATP synthase subunit delta [candidate division Zixibacteria bacterium]
MIEQQVAKRYAAALFTAAKSKDMVDKVSEELNLLRSIITTDRALINFLDAPQIKDEDKLSLVDAIFKENFSELVYSFVRVTVDKRRSTHMIAIIDQFANLFEEEKGVLRVNVTTAVPLEGDLRDKIKSKLKEITGKEIILFPRVNEKIIGGMIINMKNHVIDGSVRHRLTNIRNQLIALKVH